MKKKTEETVMDSPRQSWWTPEHMYYAGLDDDDDGPDFLDGRQLTSEREKDDAADAWLVQLGRKLGHERIYDRARLIWYSTPEYREQQYQIRRAEREAEEAEARRISEIQQRAKANRAKRELGG